MGSPPPAANGITAIILAGGAGSRVGGRDKGLLHWQGRPLVEHALERLANAGISRIVISANRNLERYSGFGHAVVTDAAPGHAGPLAGIAAGLAAVPTGLALTVPVDAPLWPDSLVGRLAESLQEGAMRCAVATDGRERQPLFAVYASSLAEIARAALERGERAVWRFQDEVGACEVAFDDAEGEFANINELTDLP